MGSESGAEVVGQLESHGRHRLQTRLDGLDDDPPFHGSPSST